MRAAVLIKQVPDLRAGSVAMRPDGTIDRGSAPSIVNPADLHALEAALQLADEVVAISMGPPAAESALRDALAYGADEAHLVTDRAFAGSDTWATANILAAAIEHVGPVDLVFCGLSAIDGETGQVGPQIAERLDWPQVTGCEHLDPGDEQVVARRVVEGGYETVSVSAPAVVTITETGFTPHYPTLPRRRRAATAEIARIGPHDLGLADDRIGLAASPTKVAHMESVPLPSVETKWVGTDLDYDTLAATLQAQGAGGSPRAAEGGGTGAAAPVDADQDAARVWVVCELVDGALAAVSAQLLSRARELTRDLGGSVAAFIAGHGIDRARADASAFGADLVILADDEGLAPYATLPHARVLGDALERFRPDVVLLGATSTGRDLAPRVAARLNTGLAADCTDLVIADWERRGETFSDLLHQIRPAMGSSVLATCVCPRTRPQMATIRPGVFSATEAPRRSRIQPVPVDLQPEDRRVTVMERTVKPADASLTDAPIIVAGGAGCSADSWHLVEDLADALDGQVAASRAAVEAGLAPRGLQVGQTGTTVEPELYLACGISGSFQHVVGMRAASTVVAINRDPEAAIFRYAHYGIVADVADAVPALTAALRSV
jgi:electron transfer flavoprotein alpha subunit